MSNANQIAFNRVVKHLIKQNKCSRDAEGCMYRGPKGLKCAVGVLISDKYYYPNLEGKSPNDTVVMEAVKRSMRKGSVDRAMLEALQRIHDCDMDDGFTRCTADNLRRVAREYSLTMPKQLQNFLHL